MDGRRLRSSSTSSVRLGRGEEFNHLSGDSENDIENKLKIKQNCWKTLSPTPSLLNRVRPSRQYIDNMEYGIELQLGTWAVFGISVRVKLQLRPRLSILSVYPCWISLWELYVVIVLFSFSKVELFMGHFWIKMVILLWSISKSKKKTPKAEGK